MSPIKRIRQTWEHVGEHLDEVQAKRRRRRAPLKRLTVLLDLDNCLICSQLFDSEAACIANALQAAASGRKAYGDQILVPLRGSVLAKVNLRPGLWAFLRAVTRRFDTYVFTSSSESYAKPILDCLEMGGARFRGRLYRPACRVRSCKRWPRVFVKDLRVTGLDLSRAVLVDDNPLMFAKNPDNGIPVPKFFNDPSDAELARVYTLLDMLDTARDVRPILRRLFNLPSHMGAAMKLIDKLEEIHTPTPLQVSS